MNETVRPRCFDATDLETARQALAGVAGGGKRSALARTGFCP